MSSERKTERQRARFDTIELYKRLLQELRTGNYPTKARLARIVRRDKRTVQRILKVLKDQHGAPIAFDRGQNGFHLTDPHWTLPEIRLGAGELISFFVAERALRHASPTAEVQLARQSLAKLAAYLPEEVVINIERLDAAIDIAPEPALETPPLILQQLAEAVTNRETLHLTYFSQRENQLTYRNVDVLTLHNYLGEWYAVGWDHHTQAVRDFHAGRIRSLFNTRRRFQLPEDWNPQAYLSHGFGMFRGGLPLTVEIEFDPYQARYIRERTYHPTQVNQDLPDQRLRVSFSVTEAALPQVVRWLMQFGHHAVAVAPPSLREMVRARLQETLTLYSAPSS
jgi:predicted DNA-binding transcriptional regulator YafY